MTYAECAALISIARRFRDFREEMIADGSYPQDVIQYRREREISETAKQVTAELEREAHYAARQRLHELQTHEDIDPWTLQKLQTATGSNSRTYTNVSHDEVSGLYQAITHKMLLSKTVLFAFPQDMVPRLSRIIHDAKTAVKTNVESMTLKAERSKRGPVVSFIIGKTVSLRDGLQRSETDKFVFHDTRYIRVSQFAEASRGRMVSVQTDMNRPLTRVHLRAFHDLLTWL